MPIRSILAIAGRLKPSLRRAFLQSVARLRSTISESRIALAFAHRDINTLTALVDGAQLGAHAEAMRRVLERAFLEAADVALLNIPETRLNAFARKALTLQLKKTNALAIEAARFSSTRITEVSQSTRAAVRQIVVRAASEMTTAQAADVIKGMVGLHSRDIRALARLHESLEESGRSTEQMARMMRRAAARKLAARGETIARTEIVDAVNGGQQALWKRATLHGELRGMQREWLANPGACPICEYLDGQRASITGVFRTSRGRTIQRPPAHPRCRCTMGLVSAR